MTLYVTLFIYDLIMKRIKINNTIHIIKSRAVWNINPVTRTVPSKKNYSRISQNKIIRNAQIDY